MTHDLANKGPGISSAQNIGNDAQSALYANKPAQWILGEIGGDDFGIDFQVTAFGPGNSGAQCYFNIQLKGTTQAKSRSTDGQYLSYPFKRTTRNLWHRSGSAVLVALADLIDSRDPKIAKVYFHFANVDLDEILPDLPPDQENVTLRIPVCQLVHRELDILPIVLPYLDEFREARQLARDKKLATGTLASQAASIATIRGNTGTTPEILPTGEEIEALIDTLPHKIDLKTALAAQRSGDYERVLRFAPPPSLKKMEWSQQEIAVCAYLRARAFEEMGNSDEAEAMIDIAASLLPNNDDIAALAAQRQFAAIDLGLKGHHALQTLLASLKNHKGPSVTCLNAKILALNGDFDAARKILASLPLDKSSTTMVVISIIEHDWDRALIEIEKYRSLPTLRENQLFVLNALEAKSHFESALAGAERPTEGDFIIPSTGLLGIDYEKLHLAYDASMRMMLAGQRLNWPASIQYVMDVFLISSMLLGYAEDALPLLAALAFARPNVTQIREAVAKFAVQFDQPEIAVQLGDLSAHAVRFKNESAVMAVAAYKVGNVPKALNYITDEFLAETSTDDVYLSALLMMGIASSSTLHFGLLDKIRSRLGLNIESRHYRAILDSAVQIQKSLLQRSEALKELYEYWVSKNHPAVVGYHLLINSNPMDANEAALIVEVATNIEVKNSLDEDHSAIFGQALITLHKIKDAVIQLKEICKRFDQAPRLKSLLGIALELDGQSPKAYQLIGELLESGEASETARRYFIQIAARIGFFDKAEEQVRAALARASNSKRRMQHLNTLFQLLLAVGNRQKDLEEMAWEYGKLANKNDEREEGIFLQEYLMATLQRELAEIQPERVQEYRERLDTYSERFPKSKYLWRSEMPTGGPPEEIVAALQKAVGLTNQDIADGIEIERKMDRGFLHIPFSWRPKKFLRGVTDIFMLWHIRKQAPLERAAFHFQCTVAGYDRHTPSNLNANEAVISLTSLLLLEEIGLLGTALDSFQHIVVARSTLVALREAQNIFTAGWEQDKAVGIMTKLQERFAKISHPPYRTEDHPQNFPSWYYEEKLAMQEHRRVYFCDDIIETVFVCGLDGLEPAKSSMTTADFLSWADQTAEILTSQDVAVALGHLIRLKVGSINIQQRYLIASIPNALQLATTQAAADEATLNAEALRSILGGLWDSSKPFDEVREHFASTMSYLLNNGNANEAVLVTFWLRWLQAIRLQIKPPLPVEWKLASGFITILVHLDNDKSIIYRLWRSLWTAIQRGLATDLHESEDITGVKIIASFLGYARATETEGNITQAGLLFTKAKKGLEQGTELEAKFDAIYMDSMVKETMKQQNTTAP